MKETKFKTRRFTLYCIGLFMIALGISFSIKSNLGVSPVNSIPYIVSLILGVDMGICTTTVFVAFILFQMFLLKKEFKMINLLQIFSAMIFGALVSMTETLTFPITANSIYIIQILFLIISIILIATGVFFYLSSDILSLPSEGVTKAVSHKFKIPLSKSKIIFDCSMVTIAIILSVIFLSKPTGIREGTIFSAIGVGFCMKVVHRFLNDKLKYFLGFSGR
ncbi:MAG: DUF6198 family protein [Hungatella sp.]|jgi:uncharacterized membrane protein YczE|nr:DUF6198 family protein [Hungatella sp.]